MGQYTLIHFNCEFNKNTPIIPMLKYLVGDYKQQPKHIPDHEFFRCDRWLVLATCDSYYFPHDTKSSLRYDDIAGSYFLNITSNLKNYDREIEKFVNWIVPYLEESHENFLGYILQEAADKPELLLLDELRKEILNDPK